MHTCACMKPSTNGRSLPNDDRISDNKIRKISKFYCHGISQQNKRFWTIFHKFSPLPDPLQNANFINIVVSASLKWGVSHYFGGVVASLTKYRAIWGISAIVLQYLAIWSGPPFCRAFVVMNFHSESVDFVMDFCMTFFCGFLGAYLPCKRRPENRQRNPQQNSQQSPAKSTHVAENPLCRKMGPRYGATKSGQGPHFSAESGILRHSQIGTCQSCLRLQAGQQGEG